MQKFTTLDQFQAYVRDLKGRAKAGTRRVIVCAGTACRARGAAQIAEAMKAAFQKRNVSADVRLDEASCPRATGCHGFCERGPLVVFYPENLLYERVTLKDVDEIVEKSIFDTQVIERLCYKAPGTDEVIRAYPEIPFYKRQMRLALANCGHIDPTNLDESLAVDGYQALAKVLGGIARDEVIDTITRSGLRGRGGGGFVTGRKWASCAKAKGSPKYVICNGDEGDPGAFMDCSLMEGDPHRVLEGMIIAAYAIGANQGFFYVRDEYPLAVEHLNTAIYDARAAGLLGPNILGSGFSFDLELMRGGGAFVCGESTALMASLEGKSGEPRAKYVHTTDVGLWGKPSNLNNVETYACVPEILRRGADWFASIGTKGSKGTKAFSLVGKVVNTGLVEVAMGITIDEMVMDIGGGIRNGGTFKAVQTGGPSGGIIPASMGNLTVDFDALTKVGSMMGSGGLIVMDNHDCVVDVARYYVNFLLEESCGKCTPCREGLRQLDLILDRITKGEGTEADLDRIEELADAMAVASLCGLGQTAANPVQSSLRHFRDEWVEHIRDHKCRGGVCKAFIEYKVIESKCTGCQLCAKGCPVDCISTTTEIPGSKGKLLHLIDASTCIRCGICFQECRFDAISVK